MRVNARVCACSPVYIFVCLHVCTGTSAIAAMEGTDGRGKWTPVPEEYCGAEDQSAAYVPPWAPVTHYSTWSLSSTSPSWTSPPRHLSPRTDNPLSFLLLSAVSSPAPLFCHATPILKPKKKGKKLKNKEITGQTRPLRVAFWSSGKTEGIWRDDSRRRRGAKCFYCHTSRGWSKDLFMIPQFSLDNLDL